MDMILLDTNVLGLIENSPIASVISNPRLPDNPLVACNEAFCALTGYSEEEVIGRNCRFLAGPGTEPWLTDEIRSGLREHRPTLVEILNYKSDGTPFRNAVLVAPIFDSQGKLLWFLGSQVEMPEDHLGPSLTRRRRAAEMVGGLSTRQREVLRLAARGLRNKQIAGELNLSEKTIKMHRALMMEKLGTPTIADTIRIAVEAGM